jgi:FAD/FMN-containing dehydrogenase/SAM-dependent methyltransferase
MNIAHQVVNDVTRLNPVRVLGVVAPITVEEVQQAVRTSTGPISIGGGRFSMGGQIASPGSMHFDLRALNRIHTFSPQERTIVVQAGVRWYDIQRFVDPHGLAVKIMQSYANFTVGGSLSVNVHGRYIGLGPLVLSVRWIKLVLHDGTLVRASREEHPELFFGAVGGYGALGIIVEAELELAENRRVERAHKTMPLSKYWSHFRDTVRNNPKAVFHNADLYAPHFSSVRSVTWYETDRPATIPERLQRPEARYPLHRYFLWAVSETPLGKWRHQWIVDPLLYLRKRVHWRNYEAGYDVAELEPPSRQDRTYVLQEYFVPVERLEEFVPRMAEILQRHRVNALNISIRHAAPDPGTCLSWARSETFAFVLYHKQRTRENAKRRVGVWTRELIDAALACAGTYYLPYQPHATAEQFHRAYPRARELFELKKRVDPQFRFRGVLWDQYYAPWLGAAARGAGSSGTGEFHRVFDDVDASDDFYRFLQNVFHTMPEDRLHQCIAEACGRHADDEAVYRHVQHEIPTIKPRLADLTYAVPALIRQKAEMRQQTVQILGHGRGIQGYAEIGSKGRYFRSLAQALRIEGPVYLIDEAAPGYSPVDVLERGQLGKIGTYVPLADYAPIAQGSVPSDSLDFVGCYIGLHHMTVDQLMPFVASIRRVLRPGGVFVVRDHDVSSESMRVLVSLAHTVFNAGLGEPWESNARELRCFAGVVEWVRRLAAAGFSDTGHRVLQANDPTANTLMAFVKPFTTVPQHGLEPDSAPATRTGEPAAHGMRVVGS